MEWQLFVQHTCTYVTENSTDIVTKIVDNHWVWRFGDLWAAVCTEWNRALVWDLRSDRRRLTVSNTVWTGWTKALLKGKLNIQIQTHTPEIRKGCETNFVHFVFQNKQIIRNFLYYSFCDSTSELNEAHYTGVLPVCFYIATNNPQMCVCVGGDNQFQAPKVGRYHFIRAGERVPGLWPD